MRGLPHFHQPVRRLQRREAETGKASVRLRCAEHPAANSLGFLLFHQYTDEPAPSPLAAPLRHHHQITDPGKDCAIRNCAGKADHNSRLIAGDRAHPLRAGALLRISRNAGRPVTLVQHRMQYFDIRLVGLFDGDHGTPLRPAAFRACPRGAHGARRRKAWSGTP